MKRSVITLGFSTDLCLKTLYSLSAVGLSLTPLVYELAYRYRYPPYTPYRTTVVAEGVGEYLPLYSIAIG